MFKFKVFLIIILFFISIISIDPSATNQKSTGLQSVSIPFQGIPWNVKYSSYFDPSSNSLNLYLVSLASDTFNFQDYSYGLSGLSASPITPIPFSSLHNFSSIIDFNYYRVGSSRFFLFTYYYNQSSSLGLYVFGPTNSSFTFSGSFNIVKIAQFTDSSDVFFILQNNTSFLILKYSFDLKQLTTFFSTDTTGINGNIQNVNTFMLDNKIFVSYSVYMQVANNLIESSVFILDQNGVLFNRTFNQFYFKTFTPYQNGLLFYQNQNTTFYNYNFATDQITKLMYSNIYGFDEVFAPFDNNSFTDLGDTDLSIVNIAQNKGIPVLNYQYSFNAKRSYGGNYYNQSYIQTFILNSSKYYIFSSISYNYVFYITINKINEAPQDFFQPNSGASTSFMTVGKDNNNNHQSPALWILIILGTCGVIGGGFMFFKSRSSSYKPSPKSELEPEAHTDLASKNYVTRSCPSCGSKVIPGDLFCQNCGSKVQ